MIDESVIAAIAPGCGYAPDHVGLSDVRTQVKELIYGYSSATGHDVRNYFALTKLLFQRAYDPGLMDLARAR